MIVHSSVGIGSILLDDQFLFSLGGDGNVGILNPGSEILLSLTAKKIKKSVIPVECSNLCFKEFSHVS